MKNKNEELSCTTWRWCLTLALVLVTSPVQAAAEGQGAQVPFHFNALAPQANGAEKIPEWEDDGAPLVAVELSRSGVGDLEVFTLKLTEPATILFETHGQSDTYGLLVDTAGRVLAADDNGGDGTNFRMVLTLPPGRYFLGVEVARGARGFYVLSAASENPLDDGSDDGVE